MKSIYQLAVIVLLAGLGFGYVLAAWQTPTQGPPASSGPTVYNTPEPLNVSGTAQIKSGYLGLGGPLQIIGQNNRLFVDGKVGIGPSFGSPTNLPIDSTALLDVDGQIRIRGGNFGSGGIGGKVLTAVDDTGLARWLSVTGGLTHLDEGFGIDLADYSGPGGTYNQAVTTITSSGEIAIKPSETQRKINDTCVATNQAIKTINGFITANGTVDPQCQTFVNTIQANGSSGLTLTSGGVPSTNPTDGAVSLAVNVGPGLTLNGSNQIALNINAAAGDGLRLDGSNRIAFENCTAGQNGYTWKYDSATQTWSCATFPPAPSSQPGGSVIYLRTVSGSTPVSCPGAPWSEAPRGGALTYTSEEAVTAALYNKVRVCYNTTTSCQVIYLKSRTSPAPSCPAGWTTVQSSTEYAPGGTVTNYANTCYLCN